MQKHMKVYAKVFGSVAAELADAPSTADVLTAEDVSPSVLLRERSAVKMFMRGAGDLEATDVCE